MKAQKTRIYFGGSLSGGLRAGGGWQRRGAEAKMNWVMDKHGEKAHPFSDSWWKEAQNMLKRGRHKHITQLSSDYISSLPRLCLHQISMLAIFIFFTLNEFRPNSTFKISTVTNQVRSSSAQRQKRQNLLGFEIGSMSTSRTPMNGVTFFTLCVRKSSNFLHWEHQLSLSCWAVTYGRERTCVHWITESVWICSTLHQANNLVLCGVCVPTTCTLKFHTSFLVP